MVPSTGAVQAVVGGHDWRNGHFNLALQGIRQAGSAFKPFVLASALENGISPDSVWDTQPPARVCNRKWDFSNYEGEGGGQQSVRVATWLSINGVYGRLMDQLCMQKVTEMARRLGVQVRPGDQVPAMALGAAIVHPIDMAAAYATFADMGVHHNPNFVTRVVRHGQLLFENTSPTGEQAVPPALAYEVNDVLKGVIDHGTAQAAQLGRPAAGKTGTTQNYKDAWFVGYTPQLATAVWMGYPKDEQPMLNVDGVPRVFGGSFPARIWHDFMQQALAGVPPTDWQRPQEQLQYTVLPPPPTTTTQTTVPGQPGVPPTTVPGQTIPPPVPPSTVVQGAPLEPRRLPARLSHQRE